MAGESGLPSVQNGCHTPLVSHHVPDAISTIQQGSLYHKMPVSHHIVSANVTRMALDDHGRGMVRNVH
jgi:hypothetical protein